VIKHLLLDWSGTLADDLKPVLRASNLIFEHFGASPLSRDEFKTHFRLPFAGFYEEFLPQATMAEIEALYQEHFILRDDDVVLLPHAVEFLDFCRRTGRRLTVVSSVHPNHWPVQAERLGVADRFDEVFVGVEDKKLKVREILAAGAFRPDETAFVGDMRHDVDAAREAGILSIATLTGYDAPSKLHASEPDIIVRNLRQLHRLLLHETPAAHPDTIRIRGLEIHAHIGATEDERRQPQGLRVNVALALKRGFGGLDDCLEHTVDYDALCGVLKGIAEERPRRLIETLSEDLAAGVLRSPRVASVSVEVRKFILPGTEYVAARVHRSSAAE